MVPNVIFTSYITHGVIELFENFIVNNQLSEFILSVSLLRKIPLGHLNQDPKRNLHHFSDNKGEIKLKNYSYFILNFGWQHCY